MGSYDDLLGSPLAEQEYKLPAFYDTGSYVLNALVSGSIYGGIPENRVVAFAGEEAVGKTFFAMSTAYNFLKQNENSELIYIDSEFALEKHEFAVRGFPMDRVYLARVRTIQQFATLVMGIIDRKLKNSEKKLMIVLDSFGNLSTNKELAEIAAGSDVKDMTRSQLNRAAFRSITTPLGELGVPLILTNHVYQVIGSYFPTKEMSGGGGLKYAASIIIYLSKTLDRDKDKTVTGAQIKCVSAKSRYTKEKLLVTTLLSHQKGLDRHYGLVDLALDAEVFEKAPRHIILPDGKQKFQSVIEKDPKTYFTRDVLDRIDAWAQENYRYLSFVEDETDETEPSE